MAQNESANSNREAPMTTILVPLDGSALAEQALPYARTLALLLGARVRLLTVILDDQRESQMVESIVASYGIIDPLATQRERWSLTTLTQHAESYLDSHAALLRCHGIDVEIDVRCGPAADVIVEAATDQHITMIAMATHGYSGLRRWALGSVTDRVVHATAVPVFVVRGTSTAPTEPIVFKRVMVPLDGSPLAAQALPLTADLAERARAEVLLMQTVEEIIQTYPLIVPIGRPDMIAGEMLHMLRARVGQQLDGQAALLRERGLLVATRVVTGHAAEAIIDEAERQSIDLIVMATHGYSGIKRWALGSVTDKVLHAAATPLLLVHANASA
jgi:nucleotide-binding universal stress UspA family protein